MKNFIALSLLFLFLGNLNSIAQDYESLFIQKKYDSIIELANNKNKLSSTEYYWLSNSFSAKKQEINNIQTLETAIKIYPNDSVLNLLLSHAYFNIGDYIKAKPLLIKQSDKDSKIKLARIYEFNTQNTKAIQEYKTLLANDTTNLFLLKKLGKNYFKIDSFPQAITYFSKVIQLYNNDTESLYSISRAYEKQENYEQALAYTKQALSLDSTQLLFLRQAGRLSIQTQNFHAASDYLLQSYEQNDTSFFVLKLFGIANHRIDMNLAAEELLYRAYNLDSTNLETCYFLARTLIMRNKHDKANIYLEKMYELNKAKEENLIAYYIEKIQIYKHKKQYKKVFDTHKIIYDINNDPTHLYYMASVSQAHLKNNKLAYTYYEKYLNATPEEPSEQSTNSSGMPEASIRKVAEKNYKYLKKELFFEGEIN